MNPMALRALHEGLGSRFIELNGMEVVGDYGDPVAEHSALTTSAAVLDLSFRSRLCVTGMDRVRFLHGQVTNDVKRLRVGEGCYAALITARGKMQSDLNLYCLQDEVLLDFEPGLAPAVAQRLDTYVIADDVQVADVAPLYGLLSVQGPAAEVVTRDLGLATDLPPEPFSFIRIPDELLGELYLVNQPRLGTAGFDLFVPMAALETVARKLLPAAQDAGGRACGWQAFELARIENAIPRFGVDMDDTNLPLEAGLEHRAVSFRKGCYIGQEVISRIHTYGEVAKALRGLRLADALTPLPVKGDKLFHAGKEVGYITSATSSRALGGNIALGYVRKEVNALGTELTLRTANGESSVRIDRLPFAGV